MNKNYFKITTLAIIGLFFVAGEVKAQVDLGVDVMSRYVWRGFDFGDSPSIQPALTFTAGGLEFGFWGAYATNGNPAGTELDIWASYTFDTDAGSFSLYATDYTFPTHHMGGSETWFDSDAHFIELGAGYGGTDAFPVSVFAGMFVQGDDDNSVYVELGYDADPLSFFLGFTPSEAAMYATDGAGIVNLGISGAKDLEITDAFSLGLSTSLVVNPYHENAHMLFGISF
ncbi:MAG: hypothetical protein WD355_05805 [Balneolaceae bacterium]